MTEATALVDESAAIIDALPDVELAARVEALVALSHAELVSVERASDSARHADRGIAISRATGQESWYALLMFERCLANLLLGRLTEAGEAADAALESARLGHSQPQVWALTLRSWVDLSKGDASRAVQRGEEAVALVERTHTGLFNWLAYGSLAKALLEAGEPRRARDLILQHTGGEELTRVVRGWLPHWYKTLALAELASGDMPAAHRWRDRAGASADAFPAPGRLSEARYARAAIELESGRPKEAVELATEATAGYLEAEWRIDAARARILGARALRELGEPRRAIAVLRMAHDELSACGARAYRDEAAEELRDLGERPSPRANGGAPDALSPETLSRREREVAELVATGMTNREVAEQLFVSPKTVEAHMTRILRKADLPSRAALAATVERWHRRKESHD